jgi:molybdopterin molybdotransferase
MQERVTRSGNHITLTEPPVLGQNIRRAGEDQPQGSQPVPAGHVLTAPRLALLAGCGMAQVTVGAKLRVAMFSTGSELVEPGHLLAHGQIYNSNRVMLRALLTLQWVALTDYGILPDDPALIRATLRRAASENDVVISSGGMSAGEEDHVLDALRAEDAALDVLKVAIRPGKPLTVGRIGQALFVGLPGNPYAAAITFAQIARPALRKAAGITEILDLWLPAVAAFSYDRTPGRREYIPVTWDTRDAMGRPVLNRLGHGASASLAPIAAARGIAALPAEAGHIRTGMPLMMEPLTE